MHYAYLIRALLVYILGVCQVLLALLQKPLACYLPKGLRYLKAPLTTAMLGAFLQVGVVVVAISLTIYVSTRCGGSIIITHLTHPLQRLTRLPTKSWPREFG